jgi:hypothetical protein
MGLNDIELRYCQWISDRITSALHEIYKPADELHAKTAIGVPELDEDFYDS